MSVSCPLVYDALLRASQCDGPVRLIRPASREIVSGLFSASGSQAAIREAVPLWLREEPRASNQPRLVRLTEAGIEQLLRWTPPQERAALVQGASPLYQRLFYARWGILIERLDWPADREPRDQCGARLAAEFSDAEPEAAAADFRRGIAHELTISWKRAQSDEAREGIARAMRGAGLQQLGVAGEQVTFAGRYHQSTEPMFPGDPGFVVEPGWMIHDGTGEYLLEKALVAPV